MDISSGMNWDVFFKVILTANDSRVSGLEAGLGHHVVRFKDDVQEVIGGMYVSR